GEKADEGDAGLAPTGSGEEGGCCTHIDSSSSGERLRPLGLMRMIGAGVDLELAELLHAESIAREHPLHRPADDLLRTTLEKVTEGLLLVALGMAAVADVELGFELVAGHGDAPGIEDDHVVARIEVRRPRR